MKTESPMIAVASVTGRLDVPSYDERLLCSIKSSAMPPSFQNARSQMVQSPVSRFNTAVLPQADSSCFDSQPSDHVVSNRNIKSFEAVSSTEILLSVSNTSELCCECADSHSPRLPTDSRSEVESTSAGHVNPRCCDTESSMTKPITNDNNSSPMLQLQSDVSKTLRQTPPEITKMLAKPRPNKSRKSSLSTSIIGGCQPQSTTVNLGPLNSTKQSYNNSDKVPTSQVSGKLPVEASSGLETDGIKKSEIVTDVKVNTEEGRSTRYLFKCLLIICIVLFHWC